MTHSTFSCENVRSPSGGVGLCPASADAPQQGAALHPAGLCSPAPASTPRPEGSAGKGFPFPGFIGLSVSLSQGCASPVCSLSSPYGLRYRIPPLTPLPLRKCSLQHSLLVPEAQGGPRGGWKPIPGESSKNERTAERLAVYNGCTTDWGNVPLFRRRSHRTTAKASSQGWGEGYRSP